MEESKMTFESLVDKFIEVDRELNAWQEKVDEATKIREELEKNLVQELKDKNVTDPIYHYGALIYVQDGLSKITIRYPKKVEDFINPDSK